MMLKWLSQRAWHSDVWREDSYVYKRQAKHLCDNEIYALHMMLKTNYVPSAEQVDEETICMRYLESQPVTDIEIFIAHYAQLLMALENAGLRHGDITAPHLFVLDNRPILIDWAESRTWADPRPDKRREGDSYWLCQTMCEKIGWTRSEFLAAAY